MRTTIGYGSPNKSDSAGIHGNPLGGDEITATREQLGWSAEPFDIPADALARFRKAVDQGAGYEAEWQETLAQYKVKYPEEAAQFERITSGRLPADWDKALPTYAPGI